MNKRTTRRRKGGECDPSVVFKDYKHCISSGCDKNSCIKYQYPLIDHAYESVAEMNRATAAKAEIERARELAFLKKVQSSPMYEHPKIDLNLMKPAMRHDDQLMFDEYASSLDRQMKHLIANDPEYRDRQHLSTTPIASLMNHDDLAKSFEEYSYDKLPQDIKRTVTSGMRRAEVKRLKSLMPVLRLPHLYPRGQWLRPNIETIKEEDDGP